MKILKIVVDKLPYLCFDCPYMRVREDATGQGTVCIAQGEDVAVGTYLTRNAGLCPLVEEDID